MVEVTLTGTSGMLPLKDRFMVGAFVEYNGHGVLIDCGEACQISMKRLNVKMNKIDLVLITHEHADHILGLPGLFLSMSNGGRTEEVEVMYPESMGRTLKGLMLCASKLKFNIKYTPLPIDKPVKINYKSIDKMFYIETIVLKHSVPCLGYKLQLDRKSEFLPDKARELGVPVNMFKVLHAGMAVTLDDGTVIQPSQVLGNERKPITVVNITDTVPFRDLVTFAKDADLLICEGMYGEEEMKAEMMKKGHMLMQDAAKIASLANAKKLFITHYSPANTNPWAYKAEVENIFKNAVISKDGEYIDLK